MVNDFYYSVGTKKKLRYIQQVDDIKNGFFIQNFLLRNLENVFTGFERIYFSGFFNCIFFKTNLKHFKNKLNSIFSCQIKATQ